MSRRPYQPPIQTMVPESVPVLVLAVRETASTPHLVDFLVQILSAVVENGGQIPAGSVLWVIGGSWIAVTVEAP